MVRQAGKAYVGDELAAEAEWLCLIGPAVGGTPRASESRMVERALPA